MLTRIVAYMKGIARRNTIDAEVDDELRFHIEMATEANIERGMTPQEARRVALRNLGGVTQTKEAVRQTRGGWIDAGIRDLRHGVRLLARNPRFTAAVVLTLALGIGANTAIFSVIDAVLLRPLPYRDADRLVTVASFVGMPRTGASSAMALSYPDYEDIGKLTGAVAGIAAYSSERYNLTNTAESREVQVTRTAADLFPVLGVSPALGRAFNASELHASVVASGNAKPAGMTPTIVKPFWSSEMVRPRTPASPPKFATQSA